MQSVPGLLASIVAIRCTNYVFCRHNKPWNNPDFYWTFGLFTIYTCLFYDDIVFFYGC